MKKVIFLLLLVFVMLTGCNCNAPDSQVSGHRFRQLVKIDSHMTLICDTTTDLVYLKYNAPSRGSVSLYYNAKAEPERCENVR